MRKIKNLLFVLFLVPFAFLLSACSRGVDNKVPTPSSSLTTTEISDVISSLTNKLNNISLEEQSEINGIVNKTYYFFKGTGENETVLIKKSVEVYDEDVEEFILVPADIYIGKIEENFYIVTNYKSSAEADAEVTESEYIEISESEFFFKIFKTKNSVVQKITSVIEKQQENKQIVEKLYSETDYNTSISGIKTGNNISISFSDTNVVDFTYEETLMSTTSGVTIQDVEYTNLLAEAKATLTISNNVFNNFSYSNSVLSSFNAKNNGATVVSSLSIKNLGMHNPDLNTNFSMPSITSAENIAERDGYDEREVYVSYMYTALDGENKPVLESFDLPTPTSSEGYTFEGWYYDSLFTFPIEDAENVNVFLSEIQEGFCVYAKWGNIPSVDIELDGGISYKKTKSLFIGEYADQEVSRFGYSFGGWYTSADFDESSLVSFGDRTEITEGLTLYAQWEDAGYKYITYVTNGGNFVGAVYGYSNDVINLPLYTHKAGMVFAGWYDNIELEGDPLDYEYTITEDATLYAKFEE